MGHLLQNSTVSCRDYFVPKKIFEQLKLETVHRVQHSGESFGDYVKCVKKAVAVIRVPLIVTWLKLSQGSGFFFRKQAQHL